MPSRRRICFGEPFALAFCQCPLAVGLDNCEAERESFAGLSFHGFSWSWSDSDGAPDRRDHFVPAIVTAGELVHEV